MTDMISQEPNQPKAKKGCGKKILAAFLIAAVAVTGAGVVIDKTMGPVLAKNFVAGIDKGDVQGLSVLTNVSLGKLGKGLILVDRNQFMVVVPNIPNDGDQTVVAGTKAGVNYKIDNPHDVVAVWFNPAGEHGTFDNSPEAKASIKQIVDGAVVAYDVAAQVAGSTYHVRVNDTTDETQFYQKDGAIPKGTRFVRLPVGFVQDDGSQIVAVGETETKSGPIRSVTQVTYSTPDISSTYVNASVSSALDINGLKDVITFSVKPTTLVDEFAAQVESQLSGVNAEYIARAVDVVRGDFEKIEAAKEKSEASRAMRPQPAVMGPQAPTLHFGK